MFCFVLFERLGTLQKDGVNLFGILNHVISVDVPVILYVSSVYHCASEPTLQAQQEPQYGGNATH